MSETTNTEDWYSVSLEVRDYELDLQGIVNNAIYFHYYEHARNSFLRARGLDLQALHDAGSDPVVYHAEIDYREPLRGGDRFTVLVRARSEGRLKLVFDERLVKDSGREASHGLFVVAVVSTASSRPIPVPESITRLLVGPGGD